MKEYETVFVLHPSLEDSRIEEEIEGVKQTIVANSGDVMDIERWGRRKLAYEIRKVNEGIYTLIRFRSEPKTVADLERRYRLREDVLRHLTVLSQGPPQEPHPRREDAAPHGAAQPEGVPAEPGASDLPAPEAEPGAGPPPQAEPTGSPAAEEGGPSTS